MLAAAEELFAEKGFRGAGVREITSAAGVHLSAVNYHFGSKEGLYLSVFRERFLERAGRVLASFKSRLEEGEGTPDQVVRALAEALLKGPMDDRQRVLHYRLLVREITEPSDAFDLISKQALQPFISTLVAALSPHFPGMGEEALVLSALSVFAQIIYFNFARSKVTAVTGRGYDDAFKELLVQHVASFSVGGMEGLHERDD